MNLNHLSDAELVSASKRLARVERGVLIRILHHLKEVERRRLFSALGKPSLLAFAVEELGYSEPEAIRRISAMRMLRDIPEIEPEIASGGLSLTNIVLTQTLFSKQRRAGRECDRRKVLNKLLNKSTREAQKIIFAIAPEMKARALKFEDIQDENLREKLLRLKGCYAHIADFDLTQLLHKICDEALAEKSPSAPKVNSRAELRRQVWRRDGGKCSNCGSVQALQVDHIRPKAAGGLDSLENLRLLCRNCNQRAAIDFFGRQKMERYLVPSAQGG